MTKFFRFPSTPHLAWLSTEAPPRDDKVLSRTEAREILSNEVTVEEKVDGANLGFSVTSDGRLNVQNRGQYLVEPYHGQFARLPAWLEQHGGQISDSLGESSLLFGEWCAAKHSISYDLLPDWFLVFDVYDRTEERFWSASRRNTFATALGLSTVPNLFRGKTDLSALEQLLSTRASTFRKGPMEGVVVRADTADWCSRRAKLIRSDFTQAIGEHWSRRSIEWNRRTW